MRRNSGVQTYDWTKNRGQVRATGIMVADFASE
jgi:hypothetical protein